MAQPTTFLLQFLEQNPSGDAPDVSCATHTRTNAREDPDQDPPGFAPAFSGTETLTKTIEDPDQDPHFLATQTGTRPRETADQDASIRSYFAIPRVLCSSS